MKKSENKEANSARKKTICDLAKPVKVIWNPIKHFILTDNASGIVLLISTILALIWANFAPDSYNGLWNTHAAIKLGNHALDMTVRNWINDGLMTIFFLLVALEIKREMLVGELSSFSQAILPVVAAACGMLVPALLFTLVAHGTPYAHGWGIPVATDIAFALGAITIVGRRVPAGIKVFLVALAIADDLGAILVIAIFYPTGLNFTALLLGALIFGLLLLTNRLGVRTLIWYSLGGLALWFCIHHSGVHSTIAGVLLAIALPSWSRSDLPRFRNTLRVIYKNIIERPHPEMGILSDNRLLQAINALSNSTNRVMLTMFAVENYLSNWVAMIIMPLFALANAGVTINSVGMSIFSDPLAHGIALGLVVGKPVGIVLGTYIVVKLGFAQLPRFANWKHIWGAGMLGGIGFTMSLFVAGLALGEGPHMDVARLSILCSSTVAAVLGYTFLRILPPVNAKAHKVGDGGPAIEEDSDQEASLQA